MVVSLFVSRYADIDRSSAQQRLPLCPPTAAFRSAKC